MTGNDFTKLNDLYYESRARRQQVVNENQNLPGVQVLDKKFNKTGPANADNVRPLKENCCEKCGESPCTCGKKKKKGGKKSLNTYKEQTRPMKKIKGSLFEQYYNTAMGEEMDDENLELGVGDETGGDEFGDDMGGDEGGDVTITLPAAAVEVLRDILAQVDGAGETEDEFGAEDEFGGEEVGGDDEAFPESVNEEETQYTQDGKVLGKDPSGHSKTGSIHTHSQPKDNAFGGEGGGTGDGTVTDEIGSKETGEGKQLGKDPSGHSKAGSIHSSPYKKGQSK